jgi:hypothetical protein
MSVEGKKVNIVRAYDGEPMAVDQIAVIGTTNGMQKTMSQQTGLGEWRVNVLEGKDPHIRPPGESHPMLALGLGEFDDEQVRALEMAPGARITQSTVMTSDGRTHTSIAEAGRVLNREKTILQDEQAASSFVNRERPAGVNVAGGFKETDAPGGNGGSLMLVVGAAIVLYIMI